MSTFDKDDPGLGEATDDIVDIDAELEPLDEGDGRTEIVSGDSLPSLGPPPKVSGALDAPRLGQSAALPAPPPTGATKFPTGPQPALSPSGAQIAPSIGQSGPQMAPPLNQSGPQPAPPLNQSGPQMAPPLNQSGAQPAPRLGFSGAQPAPNSNQSGAQPVPNLGNSGALPAYSGPNNAVPLSPTGAYGIIPDIGIQSRDDIPVPPEKFGKGQRVLGVAATFLTAAIAIAIIAKLVVDQWVSPAKAMTWMAVGTIVPTLLVGVLSSWSERGSRLKELALGIVPAAAASAGALFLAASWSQAGVRIQAVEFVPDTPDAMSAVLADPDLNVAVEGCSRFGAKHVDPDFRMLLFSSLTLRPELAVSCLQRLPADAQLEISASLADRWSRELAAEAEAPNAEHLCSTAGGLSSLPLERPILTARLLECALNSPTVEAQGCCGTSLAATVVDDKQWAQYLQEAADYATDDRTSIGVFALSFVDSRLSVPQRELAKALNFGKPTIQRAALGFACASIEQNNIDAIPYMRASLEGKCDIDPANVPESRGVWEEICFLTQAELDADRTLPVAETMCNTAQDASVGEAVRTAQKIAFLGLKKDLEQSMAKRINLGYVKVLDEIGATTLDGDIPDYVSMDDRRRAQDNIQIPDITNRDFASPRDSDFEAFMKARKAQEPWKNTNPSYGAEYRKQKKK